MLGGDVARGAAGRSAAYIALSYCIYSYACLEYITVPDISLPTDAHPGHLPQSLVRPLATGYGPRALTNIFDKS